MYNLQYALEISRIVHEERLLEAEKHSRLRDLELANQLEIKGSPFRQMRKVMNRVMSLLF